MSSIVNPLSSVGGFQNQQLARFTAPKASTAAPGPMRSAQQAIDAGTPNLTGFDRVRDRANRSHNLYLAALKARESRQAAQTPQPAGGGYSGGGGRGGGPLTGRYNLLAGADQALQGLNAAFRKQFGYDIRVASGGRTYAEQKRLYDGYMRGLPGYNLAAKPGTSQHESGRAIDFGGALQNASSREHRWLQANAGRWGFKWTGKNFKQFEPWHWEWYG